MRHNFNSGETDSEDSGAGSGNGEYDSDDFEDADLQTEYSNFFRMRLDQSREGVRHEPLQFYRASRKKFAKKERVRKN